ncbi:MAG: glutamine synthetase [Bacteroidales bacterium]|nr:glutamine synthetase [Bacteroidales bacterium]
MNQSEIHMNPNALVSYLQKPAEEFTKDDIIKYCEENQIEMVNFRYVAEDGRLKTLNFIISSKEYLETILSAGERVDGSSLFSFIEAGSSDLYVIPRFRTAFLNPFSDVPAIDILCSFYDSTGQPLQSAPENVLIKAHEQFKKETGCTFKALAELEYYVISERDDRYPSIDQRGYHESEPFAKWEALRRDALVYIAQTGGKVKYGHSEVGCFSDGDTYYEQHEVEFLPMPAEQAVEQLIVAKWVLRMLGERYGVGISYAPKITVGKAGSGLHFHMMVERDGQNITAENGKLSDMSRKMIAGILESAGALTAFGNTIPVSYLRLVPHQEAPTYICWGDRNRSVTVRVPLGWTCANNMVAHANPVENSQMPKINKQTFEYRVGDGSADPYLLVAGLIVTALRGIRNPKALEMAEKLYADVNIFSEAFKDRLNTLEQLPTSCYASAQVLASKRDIFEADGVFPKGMIDALIKKLQSYNDDGLNERILGNNEEIAKLVAKFIHIA